MTTAAATVPRAVIPVHRPPGPRRPPTAEATWANAEAIGTAEAWDSAADAYERERDRCVDDCLDKAYAAVAARKNAVSAQGIKRPTGDARGPMPPRVRAEVAALDAYVKRSSAADPELAGMQFLAANAVNEWREPDAIARLEAVLRDHRYDPTAEYAANLLLDALLRADRIPELRRWIDELRADTTFLDGKDSLRDTLERLRTMMASR